MYIYIYVCVLKSLKKTSQFYEGNTTGARALIVTRKASVN